MTMSTKIYGITQCNTVKKARQWLEENNITVEYIDFKKIPPTTKDIEFWLTQIPKEKLINRKGTTWRKLTDNEQLEAFNSEATAINLMLTYPSIIKRPVLVHKNQVMIGFDPILYGELIVS